MSSLSLSHGLGYLSHQLLALRVHISRKLDSGGHLRVDRHLDTGRRHPKCCFKLLHRKPIPGHFTLTNNFAEILSRHTILKSRTCPFRFSIYFKKCKSSHSRLEACSRDRLWSPSKRTVSHYICLKITF